MEKAEKLGGDYLDLREVAKTAVGVLVVAYVREYHPVEPTEGYDGWRFPVTCDVFIASGPMAGQVHGGERVFGAITAALRGVRNANKSKPGETPQAPKKRVGAEIGMRLRILNEGKNNEAVAGDPPSDAEYAALEKAYAAVLGEDNPATADARWTAAALKSKAARDLAAGIVPLGADLVGAGVGTPSSNGLGAPGAPAEAPPWAQ